MLMLSLDTVDCNGAKHTQLVELTAPELRLLLDKLRSAQKVTLNLHTRLCVSFDFANLGYSRFKDIISM